MTEQLEWSSYLYCTTTVLLQRVEEYWINRIYQKPTVQVSWFTISHIQCMGWSPRGTTFLTAPPVAACVSCKYSYCKSHSGTNKGFQKKSIIFIFQQFLSHENYDGVLRPQQELWEKSHNSMRKMSNFWGKVIILWGKSHRFTRKSLNLTRKSHYVFPGDKQKFVISPRPMLSRQTLVNLILENNFARFPTFLIVTHFSQVSSKTLRLNLL